MQGLPKEAMQGLSQGVTLERRLPWKMGPGKLMVRIANSGVPSNPRSSVVLKKPNQGEPPLLNRKEQSRKHVLLALQSRHNSKVLRLWQTVQGADRAHQSPPNPQTLVRLGGDRGKWSSSVTTDEHQHGTNYYKQLNDWFTSGDLLDNLKVKKCQVQRNFINFIWHFANPSFRVLFHCV